MKLRWFNFISFVLSALFLFSTLFITSCDSGNGSEKITCRLSAVKSSIPLDEDIDGDGIDEEVTHTFIQEYVYNAENKIEAILIHDDGDLIGKTTLVYNNKGLVVKALSIDLINPEEIVTYELIYNERDKPQEVREWASGNDLSGPPYRILTFSHDGNDRLVRTEISYPAFGSINSFRRYEYDNHGNVTKMFLGYGATESLYLENLSFDTKLKYYSLAPELETLLVYVFYNEPGRNNPLTARIHETNQEPHDITYNMTYDESGRIISNHPSPPALTGNVGFDEVTYHCPL